MDGCSISVDGWYDSDVEKDIVNFLVNSPKGSMLIKSIDVSKIVKDANLFSMFDNMVEEVGEQNVVQVVTSYIFNYVKAAEWWFSFECSTLHLQKFALRVLSLTCSVIGCERKWGGFHLLHT